MHLQLAQQKHNLTCLDLDFVPSWNSPQQQFLTTAQQSMLMRPITESSRTYNVSNLPRLPAVLLESAAAAQDVTWLTRAQHVLLLLCPELQPPRTRTVY